MFTHGDVVNEYLHRPSFCIFQNMDECIWRYGEILLLILRKAFEIAYDMLKSYQATDKVTLFYNDYNTYFGVKDTLNLVEFINKGETAKICGGIGMQSHVDVKSSYGLLNTAVH